MLSKTDKPKAEIRAAMVKLALIAWIKEQWRRRKYYHCNLCGWEVLKTEAKYSGWPDDTYGIHVHCGNCGHIIDAFIGFWRRDWRDQ